MSDHDNLAYDHFGHRNELPIKDIPVWRQEVEMLVEKLLELEALSHPQNESVDGKELDSIMALVLAEKLVNRLAGWAMDHCAGELLSNSTPFPSPEDDSAAQQFPDDHRHEAAGSEYFQTKEQSDAKTGRRILTGIMSRSAWLPLSLRGGLSEALQRLDFGEVQPLLSPQSPRPKKTYDEWQLSLRAIEHVHFLAGYGKKKEDVYEVVAGAFGVGTDAVKSWDKDISGPGGHFDKAAVKLAKQTAERLGKRLQYLQLQLRKSDVDSMFIDNMLLTYGPDALEENAKLYKRLQRARKDARSNKRSGETGK